jgi:hypothetical protein
MKLLVAVELSSTLKFDEFFKPLTCWNYAEL